MTVQALNYTPKALVDLERRISFFENKYRAQIMSGGGLSRDIEGLRVIADVLAIAEVFQLPDGGILMDRERRYPDLQGEGIRPPYPVVALEFTMSPEVSEGLPYRLPNSTKRIVLVTEHYDQDRNNYGITIQPISYADDGEGGGSWGFSLRRLFVPYDYTGDDKNAPFAELLDVTPDFVAAEIIDQNKSKDSCEAYANAEAWAGLYAYMDLCSTLACKNVRAQRHQQSEKLQKARAKQGKSPLRDFHVLTVDGSPSSGGGAIGMDSGDRTGPRAHMRRGHVRRLGPDRLTWVSPCMVNAGAAEFVGKSYRVKP